MGYLDEELPMVSSSPMLATAPVATKPQDEQDLPTLKRVQTMLNEQMASYLTIDSLSGDEKDLTIKQQLAVNQSIVHHLREVKLLVDTIIENIREKYSE
jgi:hypothetical protein